MRPFFPFYGSKWRSARLYGPPRHGLVVEPFAGSAGYATFYEPERVLLVEADPILAGVWEYLIGVSEREIRALPDLAVGEDVRALPLPPEAHWLIGFWLNRGSATPKRRRTAYSARTDKAQLNWGERARERIASQLHRIRSWQIAEGDYTKAPGGEATWFIDPPYEDRGRYYRYSKVDYPALAGWCRDREGQIMVCENTGATWLPFRAFADIKSTRGRSLEAVWEPEPVAASLFEIDAIASEGER